MSYISISLDAHVEPAEYRVSLWYNLVIWNIYEHYRHQMENMMLPMACFGVTRCSWLRGHRRKT